MAASTDTTMGVAGVVLAAVVLVTGLVTSFVTTSASAPRETPSTTTGPASGNRAQATGHRSPHLAPATSAPLPAPPALVASGPLQSHEVFGYAPYWTLPQSSGFDVKDLTTLPTSASTPTVTGPSTRAGPGWNGYQTRTWLPGQPVPRGR